MVEHACSRAALLALALAAACSLVSACSSTRARPAQALSPLEVDATSLLATSSPGDMQPQALAEQVQDLARRGSDARALRLVARHPDVAWLALDARAQASNPALAASFDRATRCSELSSGWSALARARSDDPRRFRDFDAAVAALLGELRVGNMVRAASELPLELPPGTRAHDVQALGAARIEGLTLLLAGQHPRAAEAFEAGARAAQASNPYVAAHLWLLACAARDDDASLELARGAWTHAVGLGAALAGTGEDERLCDPGFWERALRVRPRATDWPRGVHAELARSVDAWLGLARADAAAALDPECAAWALIGAQQLARGGAEAALLSFSRAEALAVDARARGLLRLAQARALARLGRIEASQTLASAQATDPDERVSRPALAWLGALELKLGRGERARTFLARALEDDNALAWPARAQAEANLGLACLTLGEEAAGLQSLRAAQARAELERRPDELVQALRNELAYFEAQGRQEEALPLRARIETAQRQ